MANRGSLTVGSTKIEFGTLRLPDGLPTTYVQTIDRITTYGVDGSLIVNNSKQYPVFRVFATAGYGSLSAARAAGAAMQQNQGYLGTLVVTMYGDSVTLPNVLLQSFIGRPGPATAFGTYAVSSQAAELQVFATLMALEPSQ